MKHEARTARLVERLAALTDPVRLRLAQLAEQHELSVGELAKVVQLPQSTVSRHLKVLGDAGWLSRRSEGTATHYRLLPDELEPEARALWIAVRDQAALDPALAEDERRLAAVLAERREDAISFFGRVAGEWDELRADLFGREFTLRALLALLPRDWTVADVGCGTGNVAELLAPFVKRVIAIDQSTAMLDAARKRLGQLGAANVEFVQAPVEALPLADGSVNAAACVLVLHHVEDPAEALREMHRVLAPGGRAIIVDMVEHDRSIYRQTMGHVHLGFRAGPVSELLAEAGFARSRVHALPSDPQSKGPSLFVAVGER